MQHYRQEPCCYTVTPAASAKSLQEYILLLQVLKYVLLGTVWGENIMPLLVIFDTGNEYSVNFGDK